jgi:hypothetical protein
VFPHEEINRHKAHMKTLAPLSDTVGDRESVLVSQVRGLVSTA